MPYRDGTGPEGLGPSTGRGLGNCTSKEGISTPSGYYGGYGLGRRGCGRGLGRGMGRGYRPGIGRRYYQPVDRQAILKEEKEMLKRRLAEIEDLMEKSE
ncbi:hypothetical protein SAMN02745751_01546 [Dethiosulfatibacter aminovorans DSM 17477]|uniref:DUF5320 domain-containing protein n=1 Tax=Dethiosulfatibacter aminovorans DSM 17477 TaxID=1121476 RepID=A0A1M6FUQ3_9FIRM|nr:DUF5320 domain-containing protein [Dethiosulfatibacter aminovorans]SHJ01404.1 hypothetical protein SAMN02745751_01546 [Dethiosulfatibacter aminovorans DSM 17477]